MMHAYIIHCDYYNHFIHTIQSTTDNVLQHSAVVNYTTMGAAMELLT